VREISLNDALIPAAEPAPAADDAALAVRRALGLDAALVGSLAPDVRELLIEHVQRWGDPREAIAIADLLREAHGPLLYLLDVQATAQAALGNWADAQQINERRQRRSSTIAGQAFDALALQALGRAAHARQVADELAATHPKSVVAQKAAATVIARTGDFAGARALLEAYLEYDPGEPVVTLTLAQLALESNDALLAGEMAERLGPGVPANLPDAHLGELAALLEALGRSESAAAVRLERERRRQLHLLHLADLLAPYTALAPGEIVDNEAVYRNIHGPDSVPTTPAETRRVMLEATRHFGFTSLREGQANTVAAVLRGESILAVMPTGAGKSFCYQLPSLVLPRSSLIISPLIALMKDQVESLPPAARARATFINSTLTDEEISARMAGVAQGQYKLIYAAPERLRQREFLRALRSAGLDLFVIDEAHCVSLWGHDFRPDYLFLQEARQELGNPTTLAMTATAPPRVRDEIIEYMRNDEAKAAVTTNGPALAAETSAGDGSLHVIALDIFRHNLHLSALRFNNEEEKLEGVLKFAVDTAGSGIIYVNTRHKAEALAFALRDVGVVAEAYHAGMDNRGAIQDRFMSNRTRVVVATVAFGMGIDKADIRFIVHFHPSRSLAGYYQEVGRAGRDGKPSQGVLFYSTNDWANLRRWARADEYGAEFLERVYAGLSAQLGAGEEERTETLVGAVDARRLQRVLNSDETAVRVAVSLLERADLLTRSFDVAQDLTIALPRKLPAAARDDTDFLDLLRGLGLAAGQSANFKIGSIAQFMGWSVADIDAILLDWELAGYLKITRSHRAMSITLPPRPADLHGRLERLLAQSQALGQRRIDDMVGYATAEGCRHGYISAHFGSPPRARCSVCDNCTGIRPEIPTPGETRHPLPADDEIVPMIIDCLVSLPRPVGRSGLARILVGHLRAPTTPDKARHFGALKGLGEGGVAEQIDSLLANGMLRQYERQGYNVLAPTLSGRAEADAWLAEHPEMAAYGDPPPAGEQVGEDAQQESAETVTYTALQKALWLWRRRLAEDLGQPPYIVMSNELMLQIAETRPTTLEALANLQGMGTQRMEHYGPTIMDLITLNPPGVKDAELLQLQRASQAENKALAAEKRAVSAGVSPRLERKIYMKMQEMRQKQAVATRGRASDLASNTLLKEIARLAPASLDALDAIPGFKTSGMRNDGPQIVTFISALRESEGV
jgi:ATP-dependent DNA helicase RecQ